MALVPQPQVERRGGSFTVRRVFLVGIKCPKLQEECLNVVEARGFETVNNAEAADIVVTPHFGNDSFRRWRVAGHKIIGPPYLLSHAGRLGEDDSVFPVFASWFDPYEDVFSFTGVDHGERMRLIELIGWMGGYPCDAFNASVQTLISNTVNSPKYIKAQEWNKSVLLPSYVDNCWSKRQRLDREGYERFSFVFKLGHFKFGSLFLSRFKLSSVSSPISRARGTTSRRSPASTFSCPASTRSETRRWKARCARTAACSPNSAARGSSWSRTPSTASSRRPRRRRSTARCRAGSTAAWRRCASWRSST